MNKQQSINRLSNVIDYGWNLCEQDKSEAAELLRDELAVIKVNYLYEPEPKYAVDAAYYDALEEIDRYRYRVKHLNGRRSE